jgi:hypothetical protein
MEVLLLDLGAFYFLDKILYIILVSTHYPQRLIFSNDVCVRY